MEKYLVWKSAELSRILTNHNRVRLSTFGLWPISRLGLILTNHNRVRLAFGLYLVRYKILTNQNRVRLCCLALTYISFGTKFWPITTEYVSAVWPWPISRSGLILTNHNRVRLAFDLYLVRHTKFWPITTEYVWPLTYISFGTTILTNHNRVRGHDLNLWPISRSTLCCECT